MTPRERQWARDMKSMLECADEMARGIIDDRHRSFTVVHAEAYLKLRIKLSNDSVLFEEANQ